MVELSKRNAVKEGVTEKATFMKADLFETDLSKATRAGSNPLVVKAVGLDNHNGNPILSVADANRVLIENGATGFLDRTNVVFVR